MQHCTQIWCSIMEAMSICRLDKLSIHLYHACAIVCKPSSRAHQAAHKGVELLRLPGSYAGQGSCQGPRQGGTEQRILPGQQAPQAAQAAQRRVRGHQVCLHGSPVSIALWDSPQAVEVQSRERGWSFQLPGAVLSFWDRLKLGQVIARLSLPH